MVYYGARSRCLDCLGRDPTRTGEQGHPWPATSRQGHTWPATRGQGHGWPPRTGSHVAGRPRTGSPMAGHSGSESHLAVADRVTLGRRGQGHTWPATLGQGHPRPASARTANHAGGRCQGPPPPPPSPGTPRPPPHGATYGPLAAQTTSRDPRDLTLQISETLARRCSGGGVGDDWR